MTIIHPFSKPYWHRLVLATLMLMLGSVIIPAKARADFLEPGFETPVLPNTGLNSYLIGNQIVGSPWTFSGSASNPGGYSGMSGDYTGFTYAETQDPGAGPNGVPDGIQVAVIDNLGTISQATTLAAGTYNVTFVATPVVGVAVDSIQVLVDGMPEGTIIPQAGSYQTYVSNAFTAIAGVHTITLAGLNTQGNAADVIDSVHIQSANQKIHTHYDTIPNFGASPTTYSVNSGNWSSPNTWSTGVVPAAGDIVSITANTTVTYDIVSTAALDTVEISSGGTLAFQTNVNTQLTAVNLIVLEGGTLQIGTQATPIASNVTAQVVFADQPINIGIDPLQYGHGLIALGTVTMHGMTLSDTFLRVATEPHAGDTTLTLSATVTGWRPGDKLFLPDTRHLDNTTRGAIQPSWAPPFVNQIETPVIASVSGTTVTLVAPLQYDHLGARDASGTLKYLPHVADETRNVTVHSQSATGTRAYTLFTYHANVDIEYVVFKGMGRTKQGPADSTTVDAVGDITYTGINQDGRFPITFWHLVGPAAPQANGHQYTFVGNFVNCPLTPMPFRWGVTLNDSHYGLIQDNIIVNWAGSSLVVESGNETGNLIKHNFIAQTTGPGDRDPFGFAGDGVWLAGVNNSFEYNVIADSAFYPSGSIGGTFASGIDINLGNDTTPVNIPNAQGADPYYPDQQMAVVRQTMPFPDDFIGNEVYGGTTPEVLSYYNLNAGNSYPLDGPGQTIKNLVGWHTFFAGTYAYQSNKLTMDGYTYLCDKGVLAGGNSNSNGWLASDYYTKAFTLTNADIENCWSGVASAQDEDGGDGSAFTIKNSKLVNQYNIGWGPMWNVSSSVDWFWPKTLIVDNVTFDTPLPSMPLVAISMADFTPSSPGNYIVKDQVFVYNYQGVQGDNFQVFYPSEAANATLSQSVLDNYGDGLHSILGSPDTGLTNAQNWTQYGIARAGEVAP